MAKKYGTFRPGQDELLVPADGTSFVSAENYGVALVDELDKGDAIRRRITAAS